LFVVDYQSPIAGLAQKLGELLEVLLVFLIVARGECAVDIDDGYSL
jgi:hypothetical protein